MLVQVERFSRIPGDAALVTLRTSVGTVPASWGGNLKAAVGEHHIEWELDEDFRWGFNCSPAAVEEPCLYQTESGVFCRGRLGLTGIQAAQAFAHLELADAVIDLGHIDGLPQGMAGAWVEINLRPEKIKIHPYQI
ncbi:hypothetical protein DMH03_25880 [Amycolatopsis sp. WAC 01376]|uniref:hypothetical protein n=1 Tax=Amycolatopsis sp. WAC 01376 TaxID=2203195 RepID=UPI000F772932|nr:hypothetical protein [Amycolatopsis sp. WAC 01376]RSM59281.1 hypothetical protein DMH03_25880 [Amycolatopsis sp. WAC 01376]